jgi:hypothetical protein
MQTFPNLDQSFLHELARLGPKEVSDVHRIVHLEVRVGVELLVRLLRRHPDTL